MRSVFKGFLLLRLIGFLVLVIVLAIVLGIRSLVRGSDLAGAVILLGAVVLTALVASLVAHRGGSGRR